MTKDQRVSGGSRNPLPDEWDVSWGASEYGFIYVGKYFMSWGAGNAVVIGFEF